MKKEQREDTAGETGGNLELIQAPQACVVKPNEGPEMKMNILNKQPHWLKVTIFYFHYFWLKPALVGVSVKSQQRRMWKIVRIHFYLTVFFFFKLIAVDGQMTWKRPGGVVTFRPPEKFIKLN